MKNNEQAQSRAEEPSTRISASSASAGNAVVPDEVVYFEGSPALRGHLGRFVMYGLAGILLIAGSVVMRDFGWWVPLVGLTVGSIVIVMPVIFVRTVRYRISSYRIDYERGVLSKDIDTLELWHVDDLKFHQSMLDRILRVGEIIVVSGDETTPMLHISALPNPRPVFDTLKSRIITVKRQRGVIKLDAG